MSLIRYYCPEFINSSLWYLIGQVRCFVQQYVDDSFTASQITENIFIGNLASAANKQVMVDQGITHVLCCINGGYEFYPENFKYLVIHINDDAWVDIGQYFNQAIQFVNSALDQNPDSKILIHCQKGVSRSVTITLAYLLWMLNQQHQIPREQIDRVVDEMILAVREKRKEANPNDGFIKALKKYIYIINNYDYPPEFDTINAADVIVSKHDKIDEDLDKNILDDYSQ